ncbi:hypothetical protein ACFQBQ_07240 [Granulicella cerasi]|uniref:Peptidase C39 domain-containing protein n=1 Tax=Granulicella cerasi TaxID=741063 RepID=A0ABW1ZB20_9BACT
MKLPDWWSAPSKILKLDGHCGPLAAWSALHHYGKKPAAAKIISACRHTKRHGAFTVHLAAGLRELGLQVSFHTDPDNDIGAYEMIGYRRLKRLGIPVECAIGLPELLAQRKMGRIPIVLYDTPSEVGHFSIIVGASRGKLTLAEGKTISVEDFMSAWTAPRILRQCVIAWR